MATALEIVTSSARLLGVVRKGMALDNDEATSALDSLNDLLASWASDTLLNVARIRENFTLSSAESFTIGTGKTLDTPAPVHISDAFIRTGTIDYPLTYISEEEYNTLPMKSISGGPSWYYTYSRSSTEDAGTIRLYPVPTGGDVLYLLSEKKTPVISSLSTEVFFPNAGANRAIRYNLALELAPEYGKEPSALLIKIAKDSLGAMRTETARSRKLVYGGGLPPQRNVYNGWMI